MAVPPMTVVETQEFLKRSKPLLSASDRADLSQSKLNEMKRLVPALVAGYGIRG